MTLALPLLLVPLAAGNPARQSCDLCRPARVAPMPPQFGPAMPPPDAAGPLVPCPPLGPPAPLLAVQVVAPAGTKVTAQPGTPAPSFTAPVTFGFRPGYAYRLELADIPGRPGVRLYPTLEVRGSIVPRPGMMYMDYPLAVTITPADLDRVTGGGVVTKIAYLEDPAKAIPTAARPGEPIELTDLTVEQAITEATANGRVVAVLRIGDRQPAPDELAHAAVPNTVLLPGEMALAAPTAPPQFGWCGVPMYDPILGPKPAGEECIPDGGDRGPRLGIGPGGLLGGLNPTDVAVGYSLLGKRKVTTSNVVCVCVPRFVLRRVEVAPNGLIHAVSREGVHQAEGNRISSQAVPALAMAIREKAAAFATRQRPSITVLVSGVLEVVGLSKPQGLATVSGLAQAVAVVEPAEITRPGDLVVTKTVEPAGAVKQGDEVTFTIRYRNGLLEPVTDLVLSDSLSGRFEYVAGSAKQDRPANTTTLPNEAGSVTVRFDIPGPIPPGGYGVVTFRAKVR
jgi:uncharacterized repeat protein (TIGR01451 family)